MAPRVDAGTLLSPARPRIGSLPVGVGRGRTLALGHTALADLRSRKTAVVGGFPLGRDATVELTLRRFEPSAPNARVEVMEEGGARELVLPDHVYFAGTVTGEPRSR